LLLALLARDASSQVLYGSIAGVVTDPSGSAVPNVAIAITHPSSSLNRKSITDDGGRYSISDLAPGAYDLRLSRDGFRAWSQTGVVVAMNTVTRVDAALELGPATETVTVMADTAVDRDKADVHVNFDDTDV
jgi:hypothetical protein